MNICESTIEERELLDSKLVDFNRKNVPFQQGEDWIGLSYVLKDNIGQAIAGINATLYCWNIMYVDILYVDDSHRGKGCGKLLLDRAEDKAKSLGGYSRIWILLIGRRKNSMNILVTWFSAFWKIAHVVTLGIT